jgi:hypothetical protein
VTDARLELTLRRGGEELFGLFAIVERVARETEILSVFRRPPCHHLRRLAGALLVEVAHSEAVLRLIRWF